MKIQTITVEESEKLLDYFDGDYKTQKQKVQNLRNKTMILLMLDAGLRVGEISKLKVSDLIVSNEPVHALLVKADIAKNKSERIIPLSSRLQFEIQGMYNILWSYHTVGFAAYAFYNSQKTTHLSTRQIERIVKKSALLAFGRAIHPHVLRHTFATRLMRTTSSRIVQKLLGHKHLNTTELYTHPDQTDLSNAISQMERNENGSNREKI